MATVGISAVEAEILFFMCTSMGNAMEVLKGIICCNKTLHAQNNASSFSCQVLEN